MGWVKKKFTNSPVPDLSTQLLTLVRQSLDFLWFNHLHAGDFQRDGDEELLEKPGRMLTKTLGCAPEYLLFSAQIFVL